MEFGPEVVRDVAVSGLQGRERMLVIGYLASRAAGVTIGGPCWNRVAHLAVTLGYEDAPAA